jgi:hypothetical protein
VTTDRAREARLLVRAHRSGVLSTHSVKLAGYPYGSALPHLADHAGRPWLLISHLAEHTHNLEADARASFIVCETGADLQSRPRVTLVGEARALPGDTDAVARRYLRYYPDHERYLQIGGFRFYAIEPAQVRFIQGFGGLHWIPGASYLAPAAMAQFEDEIVEHMNHEHAAAMRAYCATRGHEPLACEMVGIDCDGFDLRADRQLLRFDFPAPAFTPEQARAALVRLARDSRGGG